MINPKELRLGLLIDIINRSNEVHMPMGQIFVVWSIHIGSVEVYLYGKEPTQLTDSDIFKVPIRDINPIPLTEDWLVKFGAYNKPLNGPLGPHTNDWDFIDDIGSFLKLWRVDDNRWNYVINNHHDSLKRKFSSIKYIHTLQNLYFALTGEELTLTQQ